MAHFKIIREARAPIADGWSLCFQFGIYEYEPDDATEVSAESGYRFIWRRPNGQLQGARGQARLEPPWITILLGKAAEAGWYPVPPSVELSLGSSRASTRADIIVDGIAWRLRAQPPIAVGARAPGDSLPEAPEAGIWFSSVEGRHFLPMDYPELQNTAKLRALPVERLRELLELAKDKSRNAVTTDGA